MAVSLVGQVIKALQSVTDPETAQDVWRMQLIRHLDVNEDGEVEMIFQPSSFFCPLAFSLGPRIKEAVRAVDGVRRVQVKVEGFVQAVELDSVLREMDEGRR
jgi:metal-sulfur cluster biosynthetic enzyme